MDGLIQNQYIEYGAIHIFYGERCFNVKGLEKELDRLTSRLVSAMANRDSLEEVMVIIK